MGTAILGLRIGEALGLERRAAPVKPGTIAITYGAPIDTAAYGLRRKRELTAEVRRRIAGPAGLEAGEVAEE